MHSLVFGCGLVALCPPNPLGFGGEITRPMRGQAVGVVVQGRKTLKRVSPTSESPNFLSFLIFVASVSVVKFPVRALS